MKPIVGGQLPGRNDPCPCGSGLKFKRCHGDAAFKNTAFRVSQKAYHDAMQAQIDERVLHTAQTHTVEGDQE